MKILFAICLGVIMPGIITDAIAQEVIRIGSPGKKVVVTVRMENYGNDVYYDAAAGGKIILYRSKLGLIREDDDFSTNMKWLGVTPAKTVKVNYTMLNAKKRKINYEAKQFTVLLESAKGKKMNIIFQVSDDGFAFRYHFPETSAAIHKIKEEITSFAFHYSFTDSTTTWLQPKAEAQSGWEHSNPSYEENYMIAQPGGTPSTSTNGFVFPALFKMNGKWIAITEAGLGTNYCGTGLRQHAPNEEYSISFPQAAEGMKGKPVNPESTLPWYTPWRVIAMGELKTVMESTLGTDLAEPAIKMNTSFVKPGKASWSWAIAHDNAVNYAESKLFIDYASDMKWEYTLIDVNWDTRIGYDSIKLLCDYAATRNVGVLLWYNSAGDWNTTPYHPKSKLLTQEDRIKEFTRIKNMGVKGVKIDFFAGDGQSMIAYYHDILKDAATVGLLINFHGATLPRGWQRTYPHLMTMESVKGFEMITFEQRNADAAPVHCTMLPFTRNLFDPMDFTPVSLYKIPRINRKTTVGYELALSILFTSGIQHYAERPEGMATVPAYVKSFLQQVPSVWDDIQFIDGYPGKYVVLARKSGKKWYVAGINGETEPRKINLDMSFIGKSLKANYITDETNTSFKQESLKPSGTTEITMQPYGGFVMVLEK